ncbi:bifunctional aldolase/short-chain dehydrogenase [Rubellimicrobium roseum]|uniref:Bifunctional aldolase/short-chain dehydrogenase n=1 Tax=Rubellimicrobium roseum TaxID=687525 RepID=A0A5C4NDM9_9RHOB|nr:bifunctional aldolase/short-chain dehydrogenase [Rubellimicrobium roseum]TNC68494.1 bifunctional aldolase/short-chain dehydrogenase [Rubellimicrobium roseum]
MFENLWRDDEAAAFETAAGDDPNARLLALRVYSSRLIGRVPDLVMHGGGNTSIKLTARDVFGDEVEVLHVKGSGADLDSITPAGLPAVRLQPLHRLRGLGALSDEAMVNVQRANLLDSAAPNPSVETLLHAWLPDRVIDHTHATPFLALANLPEVEAAVREIFGSRLALVPYIMPGFALAKAAAAVRDAHPEAEGLLLVNHGHFTWGATPRESYDRLIDQTNDVAVWLAAQGRPTNRPAQARRSDPEAGPVLAALRGALASALPKRAALPVLDLRDDDGVRSFLERPDLADLATRGVATPDHVIRTKAGPLHLNRPTLEAGPEAMRQAVVAFADRYRAYFDRQARRAATPKTMLPPMPGLVWAEGLGVVGVGATAAAARIAGDIGTQTLRVMEQGESVGGYHPIGEADTFDMEYWSLEQAKLGKGAKPPLQGRIVLVTGGAGAIGRAAARAFAGQGATVVLTDRDEGALGAALKDLGRDHGAVAADLTAPGAAARIVAACVRRFGGLDILLSNAGAAWQGEMATLSDATLRESFELNFFAHQALAQAAVAVFREQARGLGGRAGGQIIFNVSKQAVNPGKGFGAYGLPKAATFFLLRQFALELGPEGIRVNGVNADRIRSGLVTEAFIAERAQARGVTPERYMAGNLLGQEVEARHVAEAFVMLALAERTTGHAMTVDGGNIEAALR